MHLKNPEAGMSKLSLFLFQFNRTPLFDASRETTFKSLDISLFHPLTQRTWEAKDPPQSPSTS